MSIGTGSVWHSNLMFTTIRRREKFDSNISHSEMGDFFLRNKCTF
jgi:hypothetical protein